MGTTAQAQAVLQSLFHPHVPFGEDTTGEEEDQPPLPLQEEEGAFVPELLEQVTELEVQGIVAAEAGDTEKALEMFGRAIQRLPARASTYNNRAQALRLQGDVAGAMEDLDTALALSEGAGRVAHQALVQRGLLWRLQGHEEAARKDFSQAARLGSPFARQQLVLMNPYAALCNQMLAAAMRQLQGPRGHQGEPGEGEATQVLHDPSLASSCSEASSSRSEDECL